MHSALDDGMPDAEQLRNTSLQKYLPRFCKNLTGMAFIIDTPGAVDPVV
jgi:hypothetical protein